DDAEHGGAKSKMDRGHGHLLHMQRNAEVPAPRFTLGSAPSTYGATKSIAPGAKPLTTQWPPVPAHAPRSVSLERASNSAGATSTSSSPNGLTPPTACAPGALG